MLDDPDTEAVGSAVRRYFASWAAGERTDQVATPALAAVDALFGAARWPGEERSAVIRGLDIEHLSDQAAVAAIEATLVRRRGESTLETDLSGPVELQRVDGTWRVARYFRGGSPVVSRLVRDAEARAGSVRLIARAVELRAQDTGVVVEARNDGDKDARFTGAKLVGHFVISTRPLRRLRRGFLFGVVPAKQTIFREAVVPPRGTNFDRRRLVLHIGIEQDHHKHSTRLIIRP